MSQVQQYWLPGYGLSRHIVLGHIQYFLGPSASVRPYSYQGRDGYLIVGVPLTREQIDDLATMSREYERQESLRMAGDSASPAAAAATFGRHEPYINEIVPVRSSGRRSRAPPPLSSSSSSQMMDYEPRRSR
ncbi:hypothetical protein ABZX51_000610 [Aspergillus tubingensis]|uniref:Uncharacterized protein n=1 Tax=Aspergillus tubingensis (strain CBS 134.48) TaxID=767770 RepID=A0A1L9N7F8_ASPTC|nr:transcription factor RfeG [Aspergillus tubingensis]OJI85238.1 hypothetical protein ASPTUDRAFT_118630 [Aspergillus tubingensis CBS 134.48]GFN14517.1 transcription factor RfeG [Aspergillus tubingensis]